MINENLLAGSRFFIYLCIINNKNQFNMRDLLNNTLENLSDKEFRDIVMKEMIECNDSPSIDSVVIAHDYVRLFGTTWSNGLQVSLATDITIPISDFNDLVAMIKENPYLDKNHTKHYKKKNQYKLLIPSIRKYKEDGYEGDSYDLDKVISFIREKYEIYTIITPVLGKGFSLTLMKDNQMIKNILYGIETYPAAQYRALVEISEILKVN